VRRSRQQALDAPGPRRCSTDPAFRGTRALASDGVNQPLKERTFVKNRSTATPNNLHRSWVDRICCCPRRGRKAELDLKTGRDADSPLGECAPVLSTNELGLLSTGLCDPIAIFEIALPAVSEHDEIDIGVRSGYASSPGTDDCDAFHVGLLARPLAYRRKDCLILGEPRCTVHERESCRTPGGQGRFRWRSCRACYGSGRTFRSRRSALPTCSPLSHRASSPQWFISRAEQPDRAMERAISGFCPYRLKLSQRVYAYNGAAARVIRLSVARMSYSTSSAGMAGSRFTIS